MNKISEFISDISDVELEKVFNPYSDCCEIHDLDYSNQIRMKNLDLYMNAAIDMQVRTIWVARDLGYRGGRRTGLALTDEAHLDSFSNLYRGLPVRKATRSPVTGERTANIIWTMLKRISEPVFLWNVFPFHPHEAGNPMSNRSHTSKERKVGEDFLRLIIEIMQPQMILAIGGDAHKTVEKFGINNIKVRHPSYGGQNIFINQIEEAYSLHSSSKFCQKAPKLPL